MSSKKRPAKPTPEKPDEPHLSRGRALPEAIFPVAPSVESLPESYTATLQEIKTHLQPSRTWADYLRATFWP